ncbi:colicin uptake protein TolQ [bacterium BMS3Abin04]|nr:colicin uptake protein TolQ [bacterium BMS3Abin04]
MHLLALGFVYEIIAQAQTSSGGALTYLQQKFVEGGGFMWPILICLVLGLGFVIERIWTLSKSSTNTKKFVVKVRDAINNGGVKEAIELCQNTRGAVASVFHAGLLRSDEGIDAAEKAIMSYGGIEMGFLERGLVWISLFISMAPMLGFTGTVQGMIVAFDDIASANQMSPSIVANGISIAMLTTLFGLVVAMILQFFYNYLIAKIDRIVGDMEEASVELVDTLYEIQNKK